MNTNKNDIDRLTRRLMQETLEQPSSSLNARIMALIRKSKPAAEKVYIGRTPSAATLFLLLFVYLLIAGGGFYLWHLYTLEAKALTDSLRPYLPMIYTILAGLSFFFFYTQLDNWLLRKEKQRQKQA